MAELCRTYLDDSYKVFVTSILCKIRRCQWREKNDPENKRRAAQTAEPLTFPLTFGASVAFRETYEPAELSLSSLPPSCWGPSVSAEISQSRRRNRNACSPCAKRTAEKPHVLRRGFSREPGEALRPRSSLPLPPPPPSLAAPRTSIREVLQRSAAGPPIVLVNCVGVGVQRGAK